MKRKAEEIVAQPVARCTAEEVAAALMRGFEGYIVPFHVTAQTYERRFRSEHLDPYASRVYYRDFVPVGVVLVARRGWTSRIAAMGVAAEVRGQGLGRRIMREALDEARARGDRAVLLEAFEKNTPAVSLYEALGFRVLRRLVGYRREPGGHTGESADVLSDIDPLELARVVVREAEPDLPWMLAGETLAAATEPWRAFHLQGRAFALVGNPAAERLPLTALVVPRAHRRQGWGARMVRALSAAFPDRPLLVPQIVPEELAPGWFAELGWERLELSQVEMRLDLADDPREITRTPA